MLNIKDEKGIALVLALVLLVILSVLAVAMVFLGRYETRFLVKERLSDSALYIADGGIEYAINELQKSTSYQGTSTPYPVGNQGQFIVSVSTQDQPANHYQITSIGYVPDKDNPRETRKVSSLVNIIPGTPPYAVGAKEGLTVASNVTVKGDLRSDGQIKLGSNVHIEPSEPGASDGSIYTSTGMACGVWIDTNLNMQPGREIKAGGPTNDEKGGDTDQTGIWDESNIKTGDPYICERWDGDPIGDYCSVDIDEFNNYGSDKKVQYSTYTVITAEEFYLDNKVHEFKQGVQFASNITFIGEGTIWVSGSDPTDPKDYGLEICSNVHGPKLNGDSDYAKVNLIVSGGTWNKADINIKSNVKINGLISGKTEINTEQNVDIKGVIESGGTINVKQNVTIHWGDFPFKVPTEGTEQTTIVKSWREL